eukprot:1745315-Prymnesium_polylepis.1
MEVQVAASEIAQRWGMNNPTLWVMEYVRSEKFARYCLVPEETITVGDRVLKAIDHLDDSMNNQTMTQSSRPAARKESDEADPVESTLNDGLVAFKAYYKSLLLELKAWLDVKNPSKVLKGT